MKQVKVLGAVVCALLIIGMALTGCKASGKEPGNGADKKVKLIEIALTEEEYAFGVAKDQADLSGEVDAFIKQIKSDGSFDEIYNKYFGDGTPESVASAVADDSKDQLVVATNASFEPFEYMVGDQYLGIDMELAALLADHLNKELVISNMDFDAVCLSVGQGKADIAMAGLTINESRKEFVAFSTPYYNASQKIVALTDDTAFDDCKTAEEVEAVLAKLSKDVKIGVQTGTTGQFYLEGDEDWGFDGFDVDCVGYNSGSLAVQDMLNGNIQYVIIDEAPALFIVDSINELN